MKEFILQRSPNWFQSAAISAFNRYQWWTRQSGDYPGWLSKCKEAFLWDEERWRIDQASALDSFLRHAVTKSEYYSNCNPDEGLQSFPILEKRTLIREFDSICTLRDGDGVVSYTGGTTGASMKVIYSTSDVQKRFATLDWFRSLSGWRLGKRTAWFSGKKIVQDKDIENRNCYRDDWLTKTRFFSTFHINQKNFDIYWEALVDFNPEYIVGFPSSISEILTTARLRKLNYPHVVRTVFPTAETLLPSHRILFKEVLGAATKDQYASSEGAPFIIECPSGSLHILPYTGVFEVVDERGQPAREGELLVTSFQTTGTPLIRYRIGDRISLAAEGLRCSCGCSFPIVERIDGRSADFIWSPEYGRINLGNLSNSTKGVPGIISFRVFQSKPNEITVEVQGTEAFDALALQRFETELRKRMGNKMTIRIKRQSEFERKDSGKFRIVENTLSFDQMSPQNFPTLDQNENGGGDRPQG